MFGCLEKFKFGDTFKNWIKIIHKDIECKIKTNGWVTKPIKLTRGIRQGCPLSALLFVIAAEVMALNIRNNNNISGIRISKNQKRAFKISQL